MGWQVGLPAVRGKLPGGADKGSRGTDTKGQKGHDCCVCAGSPGTSWPSRNFPRPGSCAAATGKLTFLFEALSPSSLIKSSRWPGPRPCRARRRRPGAPAGGAPTGHLPPAARPRRGPGPHQAAGRRPPSGGQRRGRARCRRPPTGPRLRPAWGWQTPARLGPPLLLGPTRLGRSARGHGKSPVTRSVC